MDSGPFRGIAWGPNRQDITKLESRAVQSRFNFRKVRRNVLPDSPYVQTGSVLGYPHLQGVERGPLDLVPPISKSAYGSGQVPPTILAHEPAHILQNKGPGFGFQYKVEGGSE